MSNNFKKLEINSSKEFNKEIEEDGFIIIKFYMETCGHCRSLGNKVFEVLKEDKSFNRQNIRFLDVEVRKDGNTEIVEKFKISGVPTTVLVKEDKVLSKIVGADRDSIIEECKKMIK